MIYVIVEYNSIYGWCTYCSAGNSKIQAKKLLKKIKTEYSNKQFRIEKVKKVLKIY